MIDTNILKILESNNQDPSYSVIISSFEQPEFCNKDQLKINVQQYNPNLEEVIENNQNIIELLESELEKNRISIPNYDKIEVNSVINKTLVINSELDVNTDDQLYISKLNGVLDKESVSSLPIKKVKGNIINKIITISEKDNPNLFNKTKFRIKDNKLIISVPKKVKTLKCYINDIMVCTEDNIINDKITTPITNNLSFEITYTIDSSVNTKHIESISTQLEKIIEVQFENKYHEIPAVILTIDKENKIYSSYDLSFETDDNNDYVGVKVEFKGFKRVKKYGDINITIIGD